MTNDKAPGEYDQGYDMSWLTDKLNLVNLGQRKMKKDYLKTKCL